MKRWLWALLLVGCEGEPVVETTGDSAANDTSAVNETDPVDSTIVDSTIADSSVIDSATLLDSAMPVDSTMDSGADTAAEAGATDPACGTHKGGPMVYAGAGPAFCIDQREVTRAEYFLFLASPTKPTQPPHCDWNTSFDPLPSGLGDDYPITGIDWCDALAYCKWADKHLCGDLASGAVTADYTAATTQWSLACTNGDGAATTGWATGSSAPAAGVCHIDGPVTPAKVDAHPMCRGTKAPWNRVVNMVGNAAEWDGAGCFTSGFKPETGPVQRMSIDCGVRGGGYLNDTPSGQCFTGVSKPIDAREPYIGVRCCKKT